MIIVIIIIIYLCISFTPPPQENKLDEYHFRIINDREALRKTRESLQMSKQELENIGLFKRQVALICELDEYIYPIVQVRWWTVRNCFLYLIYTYIHFWYILFLQGNPFVYN